MIINYFHNIGFPFINHQNFQITSNILFCQDQGLVLDIIEKKKKNGDQLIYLTNNPSNWRILYLN